MLYPLVTLAWIPNDPLYDNATPPLLKGKTKDNDIVDGDVEEEVNPIVKKQLKSLKNSMDSHKLSMDTIVKYLKDNE